MYEEDTSDPILAPKRSGVGSREISDALESSLQAPQFKLSTEIPVHTKVHDYEQSMSPPAPLLHLTEEAKRDGRPYRFEEQEQVPSSQPETVRNTQDLHVRTQDLRRRSSVGSAELEPRMKSSASTASITRIPSVRSWLYSTAGSVSPGSNFSSPQIAAMLDITPLPSPNISALESWRALSISRSRASSVSSRADLPPLVLSVVNNSLFPSPTSPKKKQYANLHLSLTRSADDHYSETGRQARTRSVSDYAPEVTLPPKPKQHAVSSAFPQPDTESKHPSIDREEFIGAYRHLGKRTEDPDNVTRHNNATRQVHEEEPATKRQRTDIYTATSVITGNTRSYESLRLLGQGTFSKVYLAVRLVADRKASLDYRQESTNMAGVRARSRRLVAVKVIEPGPAGGADAERIEVSLKREIELMKVVKHPSIVHLKASGTDEKCRALLVMNYCPGGDLFDLASSKDDVLTPTLIRRIFSELVSAVRYLHQKYIVHRDIKLENVLLNIPVAVHGDVDNWLTLDRAVVTLTDLGLGRTIPAPPESPLLETRCGSEDYAAPEILMGQPYDGRQTDAWALGVLLYALMEGRLPFDPLPGVRGDPATLKARTPHRVARCDWGWVKYGDEDNEWDPSKGKELEDARKCVESLLKRSNKRTPLSEIRERPWVKDGIQIDGGLRWVEEEGL